MRDIPQLFIKQQLLKTQIFKIMKNLNTTTIAGRLTSNVQSINESFSKVSIAVNSYYKDKSGEYVDVVDYIPLQFSGGICKLVNKLTQGTQITVQGALKTGSYVNGEGTKINTFYIQVKEVSDIIKSKENADSLPAASSNEVSDDLPF